MTKRVITGALFAVLMLAGVLMQGWVMLALLAVAMIIATHEMYAAFENAGTKPVKWPGYLFCLLATAAQALEIFVSGDIQLQLAALLVSAMLGMAKLVLEGRIAVERMVATVFPMLYPGIFFLGLMALNALENRAAATAALVIALFAASINDVFALLSGMFFGKHKLSPELSPKKTIEGSIGGMIFCIAFCMAVPALLKLIFSADAAFIAQMAELPPLWSFGLLGLVAGAFSQIGDLTASMIKRHCGVKDYGKLLPGHGGIMDRMDGVLFCGAACYVFFKIAGLG
ncbi:MAG: phosphatidate cytidylyltransferase [Clostridia bacterium]|nr:phosphatidate cytidylyltransferase [Clostridia bacterium]